jgi:hypothetical protein
MSKSILTFILVIIFSNILFSQVFTTYTYPHYCHKIHCDQNNRIWYGGDNGFDVKYEFSLFRYDGSSWEGVKVKDDQYFFNCIESSPDGSVFINTSSEIMYYKNDEWKWLKLSPFTQEDIMFDKNNKLLFSSKEIEPIDDIGSYFQTFLFEYDIQSKILKKIRDYGKYPTLNSNGFYEKSILDYTRDVDGNLYLIEFFRDPKNILLSMYDCNEFKSINLPVDESKINSIYYTLKLATYESHLVLYYYYSEEKIHKLFHYNGGELIRSDVDLSALMYQKIRKIKYDSNGVLWFASGKGVYFLKDEKLYQFTEDDGLLSNDCTDLDFDKYGNVWIAHEIGVTKIEDPYSSFNETANSNDCFIFPNPTDNIAYLHHNIPFSKSLCVEVFSSDGELQQRVETKHENIIRINTSDLSGGLYIIQVTDGKELETLKLIIE